MKRVSFVLTVLVALVVLSFGLYSQSAEEVKTMTNAELVGLMSSMAGLKMPEDAENLSDAELFEIQVNMLAERGITQFVDTKADDKVTCGLIANLVYDGLIGPNDASTEAKISYLALAGYLPSCSVNDAMPYDQIVLALSIPELTKAIAEAYSAPFGGGARTGVLSAPANPAPETPLREGPATVI